jgi:hypothetical protein
LKNTWHLYLNFKSWLLLELKFWWLCCILGCFLFLKNLDTEINFYQDCIVLANVYQDTVKKLDNVKLIFSGTEIFVALVELKKWALTRFSNCCTISKRMGCLETSFYRIMQLYVLMIRWRLVFSFNQCGLTCNILCSPYCVRLFSLLVTKQCCMSTLLWRSVRLLIS